MLDIADAKEVLRIDSENTANDGLILSILTAIPSYLETVTGMSENDQINEPLVETVSGFILRLWYFADHAEDLKLQRTIDNLLKCITLKANALNRAAQ